MPATPEKIEEVHAHPLFQQLVPKQKAFVISFLTTDDRIGSVRSAGYKPGTDYTADMMGRKLLKHSLIKQLVAGALGYQDMGGILSKKELLLRMSDHIRTCTESSLFFKIVTMYSEIRGWVNKSETVDVQTLVQKMEKRKKQQRAGMKALRAKRELEQGLK